MAADIDIFGTLNNATPEGILARAQQIHDTELNQKQSDINKDYKERIENLESGGGNGIEEAPVDGKSYVRNNKQWAQLPEIGEGGTIVVDSELSDSSTNPVQNRAIKKYVDQRTNELNISVLYPTNGIDGSNKYDLAGAIAQVPLEYRSVIGLKVSFINNDEKTETWVYQGGAWAASTFFEIGVNRIKYISNYIIVDWNTDIETTRKQISVNDRKSGLQIVYNHPERGWISERYIGTSVSDTIFPVDNNLWEPIPSEKEFNEMNLKLSPSFSMAFDSINALSDKASISTPLLSKYSLFAFNKVKNIFVNDEVIKGRVKNISVYCAANSEQFIYSINNNKTYAKYLGKITSSSSEGWYDLNLDVFLYDEYIGVANVKTPYANKADGYSVGFILSARNDTALAEKDTYILSETYSNQYMWGIKVTRENYEPANLAANIIEITEKVDGSVLSVTPELKAGGYLLTGVYRDDWTDLKSTEPIEVKEGDTILFNKDRYYGKSGASVVARVDIDGTFIKSLVDGSAAWIEEMPDIYIDFNGYIVITNWGASAKSEYHILRGGVVNEVNTLKKEISTGAEFFAKKLYENKNYASLGDSITKGTGTSKPYPSILAETLNMNLTNLANPGDPLHYAIERWDALESYNFDLITIALGVNNYLNTSFQKIGDSWFKQGEDGTNELLISEVKSELSQDFRLAFNTLMFKVLSKCPTAKVMVFTPLHKRNDFKKNEAGYMLSDYVNVIKEGCNLWGVECVDMNQLININPTIDEKRAFYFPENEQEGGLHPNIEAHKLMVKEAIKRLIA